MRYYRRPDGGDTVFGQRWHRMGHPMLGGGGVDVEASTWPRVSVPSEWGVDEQHINQVTKREDQYRHRHR